MQKVNFEVQHRDTVGYYRAVKHFLFIVYRVEGVYLQLVTCDYQIESVNILMN